MNCAAAPRNSWWRSAPDLRAGRSGPPCPALWRRPGRFGRAFFRAGSGGGQRCGVSRADAPLREAARWRCRTSAARKRCERARPWRRPSAPWSGSAAGGRPEWRRSSGREDAAGHPAPQRWSEHDRATEPALSMLKRGRHDFLSAYVRHGEAGLAANAGLSIPPTCHAVLPGPSCARLASASLARLPCLVERNGAALPPARPRASREAEHRFEGLASATGSHQAPRPAPPCCGMRVAAPAAHRSSAAHSPRIQLARFRRCRRSGWPRWPRRPP